VAATVVCRGCGAPNRLDFEKGSKGPQPVCGRCKAPLSATSDVLEVSEARFDEQVLGSPVPVLLEVWATWCAPCRGMAPIIDELASSQAGRLRVAKLDIDRNPAAAARLRIQGVPTLILFREGREVTRMIGARGREDILAALALAGVA
jgi:thioredoxin 2